MSSYTPDFDLTLLATIIVVSAIAMLIMHFRTQSTMNNKVYFLPHKTPWWTLLLFYIFIGYMIIVAFQPELAHVVQNGQEIEIPPLVDLDFYYSRLVMATGLLFGGLFLFVNSLQKTAFGEIGLLYKGIVLNWKKFESYSWDNKELYKDPEIIKMMNDSISLSLTLHSRHILYPKILTFTIPFEDMPFIDAILSTKLKVKGKTP